MKIGEEKLRLEGVAVFFMAAVITLRELSIDYGCFFRSQLSLMQRIDWNPIDWCLASWRASEPENPLSAS
ncbi:hypothetical protein AD944_10105 [Acetobacter tropicalis]|nr:hypothetical protein AD944_10105 [Acetobacter tropicalis]